MELARNDGKLEWVDSWECPICFKVIDLVMCGEGHVLHHLVKHKMYNRLTARLTEEGKEIMEEGFDFGAGRETKGS